MTPVEERETDPTCRAHEVDRGLSMLSAGAIVIAVPSLARIGTGLSLGIVGDIVIAIAAVRLARAAGSRPLQRAWWIVSAGFACTAAIPPAALVLPDRPVAIAATVSFSVSAVALVRALTLLGADFGSETAKVWAVAEPRAIGRVALAGASAVAMLLVVPAAGVDGSIQITVFGIGFGSSWPAGALFIAFVASTIWAYLSVRQPYRQLRAAARWSWERMLATA